jgi:hypothetical protein
MQTAPRGETPDTRRGLAALSAGVAALLILAAAGGWYVLGGRLIKPAQAAHLSVVVLPFTNLSGDPSQDYFGEPGDLEASLVASLAGSYLRREGIQQCLQSATCSASPPHD